MSSERGAPFNSGSSDSPVNATVEADDDGHGNDTKQDQSKEESTLYLSSMYVPPNAREKQTYTSASKIIIFSQTIKICPFKQVNIVGRFSYLSFQSNM